MKSSLQVAACQDSGYDWFEQLLQNVSVHEKRRNVVHIRKQEMWALLYLQ